MDRMKILAIGDVVGKIGCEFLREKLPSIKQREGVGLVIANGENSSDGNGTTPSSAEYLFSSGVDIITGGNHSFRRKECYEYYGYAVYDMGRIQVGVINLMGCMYLESLNDPFDTADRILSRIKTAITIVDFHAEATAEKLALAYYLDGRVSAMFGTHTHVQTADEMIFENGLGYITDVGMTGPAVSVLGVKPELTIRKFREKLPVRFETAQGKCKMNCILFDVDEKSGKTVSVKRMDIR